MARRYRVAGRYGSLRRNAWVEGLEGRVLLSETVFAPRIAYPTGTVTDAGATADVNGDGHLDLLVADRAGYLNTFLGDGSGTFVAGPTSATSGNGSIGAVGDLDGDGNVDVVLRTSLGVKVILGNGDGTFGLPGESFGEISDPYGVSMGDLNGDGDADLAFVNLARSYLISVLVGNGDGTFSNRYEAVAGSPYDTVLADFNGDGKLDVAAAAGDRVYILLGQGDGTFGAPRYFATGGFAQRLACGDFNSDGNMDLAAPGSIGANTISILLGVGDGSFMAKTDYPSTRGPLDAVTNDFDGDGKLDLVVTNWGAGAGASLEFYPGIGDGTFGERTEYPTTSGMFELFSGDFNEDGRPDVAVTSYGENSVSVLLNSLPTRFGPSVSVVSPTGLQSGDIVIDYTLRDTAAAPCDIEVEYSVDGGRTWSAATAQTGGEPLTNLGSSPSGVRHTFVWASAMDIGFVVRPNVRVRIVPGARGIPAVTDAFAVDRAPTVMVELSSYSPKTNDVLTATAIKADADGDAVSLRYVWKVNGAVKRIFTSATELTDTFDLGVDGNGNKGDVITLDVTPTDGLGTGGTASASAVIENTVPVVGDVARTVAAGQIAFTAADFIRAYFDPDAGDSLHTILIASLPTHGTLTLGGAAVTINQEIPLDQVNGLLYTANEAGPDGFLWNGSSGALYAHNAARVDLFPNRAPTVTVSLGSYSPRTNDILTATATKADPDGDAVSLTFVWSVNGAVKRTFTSASLLSDTFDLSADGNGNKNDVVRVEVVPSDGAIEGEHVSRAATVVNSTPVVSGVGSRAGTWNFEAAGFINAFSDDDPGDALQMVRITSLPTYGLLRLNGVAVEAGQEIMPDRLSGLSYRPPGDYEGFDAFTWQGSDGEAYSANIGDAGLAVFAFVLAGHTPVGLYPMSLASGDFDHDGRMDLVVANPGSNTISLLLGKGDGTFASVSSYDTGRDPWSVETGDFNRDGNVDVAVTNYWDSSVSVFLGTGDGGLSPRADYGTGTWGSLSVCDANADGILDLVVAARALDIVSVLLGNGDGSFALRSDYVTGSAPGGVATADFDGNGYPDLATVCGYGVSVLMSDGRGGFAPKVDYAMSLSFFAIEAGDFNEDGRPDLVMRSGSGLSILLNRGDGSFSAAVNYPMKRWPDGISIIDFDGDGHLDVALVSDSGAGVSVFPGNGDGTFSAERGTYYGVTGPGITTGDFNGDGRMDIAATFHDGGVVGVFLNMLSTSSGTVVSIDTPLGMQSGNVRIGYTLEDGQWDPCNITVEYSLDSGGTWHAATEGLGGDGRANLASTPSGQAHTFVWASDQDIVSARGNVIVRITANDGFVETAGLSGVVRVKNVVNRAPADITLSVASVPEDQPVGTTVGILSGRDPDGDDTFTYSLAAGIDSNANANFRIDGSRLVTAVTFSYSPEVKYVIRVRATDADGLDVEKVFVIRIASLLEFGQVDGKHARKLYVADTDGDVVTFSLTGGGLGALLGSQLSLIGTTDRSVLTISVKKNGGDGLYHLTGIASDGVLRGINGSGVVLSGLVQINTLSQSAGNASVSFRFRQISDADIRVDELPVASIMVGGSVSGSRIVTTGSIGEFRAVALLDSDVLVGVATSFAGESAGSSDFTNTAAKLGSLRVTGQKLPKGSNQPGYVVNSQISAPSVGTVSLVNVVYNWEAVVVVLKDTGVLRVSQAKDEPGTAVTSGVWKEAGERPVIWRVVG